MAGLGARQMKVLSTEVYGSVLVRSVDGNFGQTFPSLTDFCETMKALGYKVKGETLEPGKEISISW